jgi:histidinol-phosphate aminotransferase
MAILPKKVVLDLGVYVSPPEGRLPFVRLDLNENTVGFPETFKGRDDGFPFNLYPEYAELVATIAKMFGVSEANVMLTNGSDEALWVIAHTFVEPAVDKALVSDPTFFTITHSLKLAGATLTAVPTKPDMTFDVNAIGWALESGVKVAIFASPDNPTGAVLDQQQLMSWCDRFPDTLFVIDEAYAEYSNLTLVNCTANYKNLLAIRSFSKAWGLAGLRLGVVVGDADLLKYLKVVRLPYSVNSAAVSAAQQILTRKEFVLQQAKQTMERKKGLVQALQSRGYKVIDGGGNFFLLGVGFNSKEFSQFLRQRGLLVRDRSQGSRPGESILWGFVRIAVGTAAENQLLLEAIDLFNAQYAVSFDLDGTLVDTTDSFDKTVDLLVHKYSGAGLTNGELNSLRLEGGFNNNWDAAEELLVRRGVRVDRQELEKEALNFYFGLAKDHEKLMIDLSLLNTIGKRHPIFIITGRSRMEYDPLWGKTFDRVCNRVYCVDDVPRAKPKPAPDHIVAMIQNHSLTHGVYIGNSVDDIQSALNAGIHSIGITSTLSGPQLQSAGAHLILDSPNELDKVFIL